MNKEDAWNKYCNQKKVAIKSRDIEFLLTFDEWVDVWVKSGHWENRGRGIGKYCMSRIGDTGAYEIGNVFIQRYEKNVSDAQRGRVHTEEHKLKNGLGNKGHVVSDETREKISAKNKGSKRTPEQRARMSAACMGRIVSTATKEKHRIFMLGRQHALKGEQK